MITEMSTLGLMGSTSQLSTDSLALVADFEVSWTDDSTTSRPWKIVTNLVEPSPLKFVSPWSIVSYWFE